MDRHSDSESECSVPEVLTREQTSEFNHGDVLNYQHSSGRDTVNQRYEQTNKRVDKFGTCIDRKDIL